MDFSINFHYARMKYAHTQFANSFRFSRSMIEQELSQIIQSFSSEKSIGKDQLKKMLDHLKRIKEQFVEMNENNFANLEEINRVSSLDIGLVQNSGKALFFTIFKRLLRM